MNKGLKEITETEDRQFYQASEALEIYISPSVIENLNPENLNEIRRAFRQYNETDRRALLLFDLQFYLKIGEGAHNKFRCRLLDDILEHIYLTYKSGYLAESWIQEVKREHREFFVALKNRNLEGAILR
ncbi:MAG: FCD domain-containing protein [Deltaproteobacteria bacterium]|nr:FCD domain-containing protein [Deltaproteobacteria bacterium]